MRVELKEPRLVERVTYLAAEQTQSIEEMLETAVQTYLDKLEKEAIHAETEAFWAMHDKLVEKYQGQHVALHRGQVVDHDEDASRLDRRVREQFGWSPVLIAPVRPVPRRDLRWIGGRIEPR
ncbi:MAG: DUF5678 domain-containing protein [Chloroflexota bacterium]|nr:DUF5678 domain-containing protein [Chloroflexota bacterium]